MTNQHRSTLSALWRWSRYALIAGVVAAAAACGATAGSTTSQGSSSHAPISASSAAAKAKTPATIANEQLTADKFTPLNVLSFGKFDVGVSQNSNAPYKYEGVYVGKNPDLIKAAVDEYNKHPQPGVTVQIVAGVRVVIRANHMHDLVKAGESIGTHGL
jgi:hypothetical protein